MCQEAEIPFGTFFFFNGVLAMRLTFFGWLLGRLTSGIIWNYGISI